MIYNSNLTNDFIVNCAFEKERNPFWYNYLKILKVYNNKIQLIICV